MDQESSKVSNLTNKSIVVLFEFLEQFEQFPVVFVAVEVLVFDVFSVGIDYAERTA